MKRIAPVGWSRRKYRKGRSALTSGHRKGGFRHDDTCGGGGLGALSATSMKALWTTLPMKRFCVPSMPEKSATPEMRPMSCRGL